MDEPWKHYANWKKLDTKGHISYYSIYLKYLEQANIQSKKTDNSCQGLRGGGEW